VVGPGFSLDIYTFVVTVECKDDIQEPLTRTWGHSSVGGAVAVGEQAGRLVTDVSLRYSLHLNFQLNFINNVIGYKLYMKCYFYSTKSMLNRKFSPKKVRQKLLRGNILVFLLIVRYSTLLHLPPPQVPL
jgi:hypothetical protein